MAPRPDPRPAPRRDPRTRPWRAALAPVLAACALAACGGDAKKPAPAPTPVPEPAAEPAAQEPLIPPEKFDEIQAFFDRKRRVVARCYTDALEAGELPRDATGYVTVSMVLAEDGAVRDAAVAKATLESDSLNRCILDLVTRWTITTLPKPLDYTYSFSFETL